MRKTPQLHNILSGDQVRLPHSLTTLFRPGFVRKIPFDVFTCLDSGYLSIKEFLISVN
jgi:hypothetical protein